MYNNQSVVSRREGYCTETFDNTKIFDVFPSRTNVVSKGSCIETSDYTKVYDGTSWKVVETTLACGYHLIVITSLTHCNQADRVLAKYIMGSLQFPGTFFL